MENLLPKLPIPLEDIQANIFLNHGRLYTWCHFLRFSGNQANTSKWIQEFSPLVTTAQKQINDRVERRQKGPDFDAGPVISFFLSKEGFKELGLPAENLPLDPSFRKGMDKADDWEENFRQPIHAMVLVGDDDANTLLAIRQKIADSLRDEDAGKLLFTEAGKKMLAKFHGQSRVVEHFGYADGISQPQFFDRDGKIIQEKTFIALSENEKNERLHLGSYFVFWKLEQNVAAFHKKIGDLARKMPLESPSLHSKEEWAGALAMGRFRDGTPLAIFNGPENSPTNNFDYEGDDEGLKCPLHAHTRKVNPRNEKFSSEKKRIVRRGVTYGKREPELSDRPEKDVGLLFMSYQASIADQFEFLLRNWADREDFPDPNTGVDPIIGRTGNQQHTQQWNTKWNRQGSRIPFDFRGMVTAKGGEYFFAPPISFLKNPDTLSSNTSGATSRSFSFVSDIPENEEIATSSNEEMAPVPQPLLVKKPFSLKNHLPGKTYFGTPERRKDPN